MDSTEDIHGILEFAATSKLKATNMAKAAAVPPPADPAKPEKVVADTTVV
jgi:hypothetical protein